MNETNNYEFHEDNEGQVSFYEHESSDQAQKEEDQKSTDDMLKDAIESQMKKIARQNMLIGAQTVCSVVLQKIVAAMNKPGKRTMNDYKRIIKDVQQFCETGLSKKINEDGETEPIETDTVQETVQN